MLGQISLTYSAIWKVTGKIGFTSFFAEMDDTQDPVPILVRLDNLASVKALEITPYFVQMTDGNKIPCRPITADEIVSDHLDELRNLMPQHQVDIDKMLVEIQADFPQEKIVKVYANLKKYMGQGRPITWRANLENILLGKRASEKRDIKKAEKLIEAIGVLSENYFWPDQIPPSGSKTGLLYFKRPIKQPANLYIQVDQEFLGLSFEVKKSDSK